MTFSLDGRHAWPSTGEVIDGKTRKVVAALQDEKGREAHSEYLVEVHFRDGAPVRAGDQFSVGRAALKLGQRYGSRNVETGELGSRLWAGRSVIDAR